MITYTSSPVEVYEVDDDVKALDRRDGQATMGHGPASSPPSLPTWTERRALRAALIAQTVLDIIG